MKRPAVLRIFLPLLLFTGLGFVVMGYHPGAEDDGIYLSGVKSDLNSSLYPHDSAFFRLQLKATVFDSWMAAFIRHTGLSVAWAELLWQALSIALVLWAVRCVVRRLFASEAARWGAVAMVAAMFTLPVAGTALFIADQYLHPRLIATALILFGVSRILAGKRWQAVPMLLLAVILHPIMGAMGISFCFSLALSPFAFARFGARALVSDEEPVLAAFFPFMFVFLPFTWIFKPPTAIWRQAIASRHWFRLYEWTWYEWLGIIGPIVIFLFLWRWAQRREEKNLERFTKAILVYALFQQGVAMIMLGPDSLITLSTLEPMRYLHLVYVFMAMMAGALIGKNLLSAKIWRWAVFLVAINIGMFWSQREMFAGSTHIELPGQSGDSPWLQAFAWIRNNTPLDAYFAMDPQYMAAPGEDYHSFRALAERSMLSDGIKDTSVVTKVMELGPVWHDQQLAQDGFAQFKLDDFERLKKRYGVNWVLVNLPAAPGLDCQWHNSLLAVCKIP